MNEDYRPIEHEGQKLIPPQGGSGTAPPRTNGSVIPALPEAKEIGWPYLVYINGKINRLEGILIALSWNLKALATASESSWDQIETLADMLEKEIATWQKKSANANP